ncbi:Translin-associated factor X-interacting protein 1 [Chytriomyces hyalinus]|nr:Translin-associated factor X-interacting protein 1 [Chytriomyces hyalinus]
MLKSIHSRAPSSHSVKRPHSASSRSTALPGEPTLSSGIISHNPANGSRAQPRLLANLLATIKDERKLLKNPQPTDPECLQIYSEAFERFINEFKTYEPVLSEIKRTYDATIETQRLKINQLEPFRSKIDIFKYEATQQLEQLRNDQEARIRQFQDACKSLERDKSALEAEILNLKGYAQSLAQELRDRDLATSDEDALRKQVHELQEQMEISETAMHEEMTRRDEEMDRKNRLFEQKLGECRTLSKDNMRLRSEISEMVPQSMQQAFQTEIDNLKSETRDLTKNLEYVKAEYEKCAYNLTMKTSIIKKMELNNTTFPDWELIIYSCSGNIQDWVAACKGADCNESIIILMRQLLMMKTMKRSPEVQATAKEENVETKPTASASKQVSDESFFVGLGIGGNVPKYLRFKGKVTNRHLSQKDTELLINDIWIAKMVHDANPKNNKNLQDFLFSFLKKRFGSQEVVAEWGYNLFHASKKYSAQSPDCKLFQQVLEGQTDEEVFHAVQETLEQLKNAFYKLDMSLHGKSQGSVPKHNCESLFKEFWPEKTPLQIMQLQNTLDADQIGDNVSYSWIFNPESDGLFLDLVKEQEEDLRLRYIEDLKTTISTLSKDAKLLGQEYMHALMNHDPDKPKDHLELYRTHGMGVTCAEEIKPRQFVEVETFLMNLKHGPLSMGKGRFISDDV